MAAYVIAYLDITDPQAFAEYRTAARATFAPYGGKPVVVDGRFEVLEGMLHPRSVVVIEFESMEQAKRWYASPEYAKLVPARQRASESSLLLVEGIPAR